MQILMTKHRPTVVISCDWSRNRRQAGSSNISKKVEIIHYIEKQTIPITLNI